MFDWSQDTQAAPVIIEDTMQNNDDIFRWVYRGLDSDQKCIPFTRSNPYCYLDYSQNKGAREQFNALTAYLDLSAVYGSERNISEPLREAPSKHIWYFVFLKRFRTHLRVNGMAFYIKAFNFNSLNHKIIIFLYHNMSFALLNELFPRKWSVWSAS